MTKRYLNSIIDGIIAIALVICLMLPFAVQWHHLIHAHDHEVCYGESDHHLHGEDINCDLSKFKVNFTALLFSPVDHKIKAVTPVSSKNRYTSLISFRNKSAKQLRAPPAVV